MQNRPVGKRTEGAESDSFHWDLLYSLIARGDGMGMTPNLFFHRDETETQWDQESQPRSLQELDTARALPKCLLFPLPSHWEPIMTVNCRVGCLRARKPWHHAN